MAFEQYSHEPYIATSGFGFPTLAKRMNIEMRLVKREPGYAALKVMENI